jgi:hypothetical protein
LRRITTHRVALALVAVAWLAQQLGVPAHAAMQLRSALASGVAAEICSAHEASTPSGATLPLRPEPARANRAPCDACTAASAPVLAATRVPQVPGQPVATPHLSHPDTAPGHSPPKRAYHSRAPPLPVS